MADHSAPPVVEAATETLTLTGRIWNSVRSLFGRPSLALRAPDPGRSDALAPSENAPKRYEFREIPLPFIVEWDRLPEIRAILRELEQGMFNRASLLSIFHERDDRISGCWAIRVNALLGTPIEFEPALVDGIVTEQTAEIADAAEVDWPKMFPEGSLDQLFKQGLDLGLSVGELVVTDDDETGRFVPRLKTWHTQWVWWNWATETYWINTSGTYDGSTGRPVMDGAGVVELPRVDRDVYSDGHWVLYCPGGFRYAFQRGLIRGTAQLALYRGWDYRDWARWNEVYGLAIRVAHMPAGASEADKTRYANSIRNLGSESMVEAPFDATKGRDSGFGVSIESANAGAGYQTFGDSLHYRDECIGNLILGQQASGEKKGGLASADGGGDQNERVRQDLLEKDARLYSVLRDQVLSWWCEWNFGDKRLCPTVTPLVQPPENTSKQAERLAAAGAAAAAIRAAWPNADMDALATELGVPLLAPGEEPIHAEPDGDEGDEPNAHANGKPPKLPKPPTGLRALSAAPKRKRPPTYADRLAEQATAHGARLMAPDVADVLAIVRKARDPQELKAALAAKYREMSPDSLADLVERAQVMAALAGRSEVLESL